jgi:putative hemolysin
LEPPQLAELFICILASLASLALASYEATFTVLSRSSLEKLVEADIPRARLMLRVYEPRHRLQLMARAGQALGAIALTVALQTFLSAYLITPIAVIVSVLVAAAVFLAAAVVRRTRFGEEGEEPRIPSVAVAYAPLHALLLPLAKVLERLAIGESSEEDFKAAKEEELRNLVEAEQETGVLEEGERDMIQGVFGFHDRVVREVMVPRVDMTAVEQSDSLRDLLDVIRETGHSRVPLYEESLDQIRGVVYVKDLLHLLVSRADLDLDRPLREFLVEDSQKEKDSIPFSHVAYHVPETKKVDELLTDLKTARTRLAIVVDEYGGTAGLVTTEDLVEEIVGEMQDEYDEEDELYVWRTPQKVVIVNPRINMDQLNELLDMDLPSNGFDTLGGFIYDHLGKVPDEGQTMNVPGLEIEVMKVEGQRIAQVLMSRVPLAPAENDDTNGNGTKR